MKLFISFIVLLLGYFCYQELSGSGAERLDEDQMQMALKDNSPEAQQLRDSFNKVLPRLGRGKGTYTPGTSPTEFDLAEGEAHLASLLQTDEDEAMVFVRRILLHSKHPVEQKIEFFHSALPTIPEEEQVTIVRLILTGNIEPELYREALKVKLSKTDDSEKDKYLRGLYQQIYDKNLKQVILEEGRAAGVEL